MSEKSTIVRIIKTLAPVTSAVAPTLAARVLERLFLTPMRRRAHPREQAWMSSAQRTTVRFDATRTMPIYMWRPDGAGASTASDGPTVLLVHGWSGRGSQLGAYVAPLLERGYRVVTFDAPAHGNAEGRRSSLPELALVIERVVDVIGPVHGIIAHSMGAAATTVALSRGVEAERVVYLAPPEHLSGYLYRMATWLGFSTDIVVSVQRRVEQRFDLPFEDARGSTIAPLLRVPLLVVHDREDPEVPYEEGDFLVSCWPGATLLSTQGLGHHRIVRDEAVVDAAVRFLLELVPAEHPAELGASADAAA